MQNPTEEEYLLAWQAFKERFADIDGKLPIYAWPGGGTLVAYVGDDNNLGEICLPCAQKVMDNLSEYSWEQFIIRAIETYDEGDVIRCVECGRTMIASYGVQPEREQ
jgi:hypothetical protein